MAWRLQSLRKDERGTSVVEFAMFAPFLGFIAMGIADLSRGFSERMALSQAVNRTIEIASSRSLRGDQDSDEVDYSFLKQQAADAAGVPLDQVTLTKWLECDGVEQPEFEGACAQDQLIARYLKLRVDSVYDPIFSFGPVATLSHANSDGTLPIFAEAAVRIQ